MKTVLGDNYHVDVWASGRDAFEVAMSLCFNGREAHYWADTVRWGRLYFWYVSEQEGMRTDHQHFTPFRHESCYTYHSTVDGEQVYSYDNSEDHWTETYQIRKFDEPRGVGVLLDPTWEWLRTATYPQEMDHDGSNKKGYRIRNADCVWEGHFGSHHGVLCAITPDWMWIGK